MTKKIAIIAIISTIIMNHFTQAKNIGIEEIIFKELPIEATHTQDSKKIGYMLIQLHTTTAGHQKESINYIGEQREILKSLEELTKTNIIQTLENAPDKKIALHEYLKKTNETLYKGNILSSYIQQEMGILKTDMEACSKEKSISDKMYFEAMQMYDQKIMEVSLNDSILHEKCVSEKRIQYNAKSILAKKIVIYLGLLQKKYDLLFIKQEIVTNNFEVFRDNILPDLQQIDQLLKQYTF